MIKGIYKTSAFISIGEVIAQVSIYPILTKRFLNRHTQLLMITTPDQKPEHSIKSIICLRIAHVNPLLMSRRNFYLSFFGIQRLHNFSSLGNAKVMGWINEQGSLTFMYTLLKREV